MEVVDGNSENVLATAHKQCAGCTANMVFNKIPMDVSSVHATLLLIVAPSPALKCSVHTMQLTFFLEIAVLVASTLASMSDVPKWIRAVQAINWFVRQEAVVHPVNLFQTAQLQHCQKIAPERDLRALQELLQCSEDAAIYVNLQIVRLFSALKLHVDQTRSQYMKMEAAVQHVNQFQTVPT